MASEEYIKTINGYLREIGKAMDKTNQYPKLLTEKEKSKLLKKSERLMTELLENNLGGYSGKNRPFWIMSAFKEVIEEFSERDVGLSWSFNDLKKHPDHK
tara:strand:- start:418 stop:717 length:300 start_codon:yes stop_codon:yes gene_type:complete